MSIDESDNAVTEAVTEAGDLPDAPAVVPAPVAEADNGSTAVTGGTGAPEDLVAAMDRLSLEQALADFVVANARVLDLTSRLTSLTAEVARLSDENTRLRIEANRLRELEASRAYQVVRAYRGASHVGRSTAGRVRGQLQRALRGR